MTAAVQPCSDHWAPAHAAVGSAAGTLAPLEAAVASGLILLALLAVLVGFFWTRLRRRAGLGVTGRHWIAAIIIFAVVVLALWATSH